MDEFRDAIARITIEGTKVRGTGFLVAPDLVATALHVVADRKTDPPTFIPGPIHLNFLDHDTDAEVLVGRWNQDADCVLLRCLNPFECRPVPLRELDHSDDIWKTRGFPDAQPVDGLTMEGKVRDYATHLTNYYATRQSTYDPVIQLFCIDCAAGNGAPVPGLSGAPVIIGSAAIGLMRFALLQQGLTVAGALYACSAQDIAALWPERLSLRPPLAVVIVLTPEQTKKLTMLLVEAFKDKPDDLERIVKFSLGIVLDDSVSSKELGEIVPGLLLTLVQRGPGTVDMLLRGAITARPGDQNLLEFSKQNFPLVLQPLNDQELVDTIIRALMVLADMKQAEEVQRIIGSYRRDFEDTRKQIGILAKYKELHNCLHVLQKKLDAITDAVEQLKTGNAAARTLGTHASELRDLARSARNQISGLATRDDEKAWIDQLDACSADIEAAARPSATAADREKVFDVPDRLGGLLVQAPGINKELFIAAKAVRLDSFAETMDTVVQRIGATVSDDSALRLADGSKSVGMLRSHLAGLVAEHYEWQYLNTLLEGAKASGKHQPQRMIPLWSQFKVKLIGLCSIYPEEDWSSKLRKMMSPWLVDAMPPEPQEPKIIEQIDYDFWVFHRECVDRFFEVDKNLNALCAKITQFADPLDSVLRAK